MAKSPPGVRAEGAEAETAGQPLIAQLKQVRVDIADAKAAAAAAAVREADECVDRAIDGFTEHVSNAIISANRDMKSSHVEKLLVRDNFSLPGSKEEPGSRIEINHERILSGIKTWAKKNGIRIRVNNLDIPRYDKLGINNIDHSIDAHARVLSIDHMLGMSQKGLVTALHGNAGIKRQQGHSRNRGWYYTETEEDKDKRIERDRECKLLKITFSWEAE